MATWYTTGTVSVTNGSTSVTGNGTAWVANTKPGEAFRGPDDRLYEIEAVVSDTNLTLADGYLGSNQSGQEYAILPVRGVLKQAYDALTSAIATMNGYIGTALAGRFGFGSESAPGVSFDGDTDTGFYRAAANQLAAATGGVRRFLLTSTTMQVDVQLTGSAVMSSPTDATGTRLVRLDYADQRYLRTLGDGIQSLTASASFNPAGGASGVEQATVKINGVPGATPARGLHGGMIGFGRPDGSGRRKAAFGAIQHDDEPNRTGLIAYCYNGTTTSTEQVYPRWYLNPWGTMYVGSEIFVNALGLNDLQDLGGDRVVHHGNLLGTVSQDGGAPTGAVIERGSNANGEYVKFADGTLICWRTANINVSTLSNQSFVFPASLINPPAVSWSQLSAVLNPALHTSNIKYVRPATSEWGVGLVSTGTSDGSSEQLRLTAIGRWF